MEVLQLSGDPYERGIVHGETLPKKIRSNVVFYKQYFLDNGVDEDEVERKAERLLHDLNESHPDYAQEIIGVAEGASCSPEEVAMVSLRHTLLYSAYAATDDSKAPAPKPDGCTSFGISPTRTEGGHTIIGQNWDWKPPVEIGMLDVRRDDGPNYIALTEAGNVFGKVGVNEHGIGFVVNGLSTPDDGEHPYRRSSHVRGRGILDSTTFDQAIGAVISTDRPTSRNYLLAQSKGTIIDIETTPDSYFYNYPTEGLITHANHFETPGIESIYEKRNPSSVFRAQRVRDLLDQNEPIGLERIKTTMSDHFSFPNAICSHRDPESEDETKTKVSLAMDLDDATLHATDGQPCTNKYTKYEVAR